MSVGARQVLEAGGVSLEVWKLPARAGFRWARRKVGDVRLITLHSAECAEVRSASENLASWIAGENGPKGAGWNLAIDCDSITLSIPFEWIAQHAGFVNAYSIGIEQAGRAEQSAEQWADDYSRAVLERTSQALAYLSQAYGIPLRFVDAAELRREHAKGGAWGVTTHAEVTRATGKPGHWDPGPHYPIAAVLARAVELGGRAA